MAEANDACAIILRTPGSISIQPKPSLIDPGSFPIDVHNHYSANGGAWASRLRYDLLLLFRLPMVTGIETAFAMPGQDLNVSKSEI